MTTPEPRYERWARALRAWGGAQDALDGALARYLEGDPAIRQVVLAGHVCTALERSAEALAAVSERIARDSVEDQEP